MLKRYITILLHLILSLGQVSPQEIKPKSSNNDSLLYYLSQVQTRNDTNILEKAISLLDNNQATQNLLTDDAIISQLTRLKGVLDRESLAVLGSSFILHHMSANDTALSPFIISHARDYLREFEDDKNETVRVNYLVILRELRRTFRNSNRSYEAISFYDSIAKKALVNKDFDLVTIAYNVLSGAYNRLGLIDKCVYYQLKSVAYLDDREEYKLLSPLFGKPGKVNRYGVLGNYLIDAKRAKEAEPYINKAIGIYAQLDSPMRFPDAPFLFLQLARCKTALEDDSSRFYYNQAAHYFKLYDPLPIEMANYYQERGNDLVRYDLDSATYYILKSKQLKDSLNLELSSFMGDLIPGYYLAKIRLKQNRPAEAIALINEELPLIREFNLRNIIIDELKLLANAYKAAGNFEQYAISLKEALDLRETIMKDEAQARTVSYELEKKMQEDEIRIASLEATNASNRKANMYFYGIIGLLVLFAATLARNIFNKQRSNKRLANKNVELSETLEKLQKTQGQLVQSEKMASLGELTAGIAHEIQNPLNFVNNFSEVNTELIDELNEQLAIGNLQQAKKISENIKANEEKIVVHGKRADAIVKSMLQHSRTSSRKKEMVDINALADEYLRLSYHGLRAKDSSFQAKFETSFDPHAGKVNVVPQEIGRVLLNLLNNAFYAVTERKKKHPDSDDPLVRISTKRRDGQIVVSVSDNGGGIPNEVADKIFQPFFTTKPTGQGTGLGLSLSYDILKAHGGELKLINKEGHGAEFVFELPANFA